MLPYSLGAAAASTVSGIIITRVGKYRPVLWGSWAIMTLGFGLMIMLDNTSNLCVIIYYGFIRSIMLTST